MHAIGTVYQTLGKYPQICTVTDIYTTRDSAGNIVNQRYVVTHQFCGRPITDYDVSAATITRGIARKNGQPS